MLLGYVNISASAIAHTCILQSHRGIKRHTHKHTHIHTHRHTHRHTHKYITCIYVYIFVCSIKNISFVMLHILEIYTLLTCVDESIL